jgi:DNA-binding NarL/FixJ family response regulator
MIDVFIAEDQEFTRQSLRERILSDDEFQVPVAVGTCREIRAEIAGRVPSVLLMDLGLPDGDGVDVIREAAARHPALPIMVISVFGDERHLIRALQAGASGYLLKDDRSHEIVAAIRELLAGGSPMSPAIARHLIKVFVAGTAASAPCDSVTLTAREQEVITLAAKGFSYFEIGQVLGLASTTVASYTKRIYEKLSVRSRAQAVYEASRLGLLDRS